MGCLTVDLLFAVVLPLNCCLLLWKLGFCWLWVDCFVDLVVLRGWCFYCAWYVVCSLVDLVGFTFCLDFY